MSAGLAAGTASGVPARDGPATAWACVGRPELPPLTELEPALRDVWAAQILTNDGPWHRRLEAAFASRFGLPALTLFSSGATALHAVLAVIGSECPDGEVVTSPFAFRATVNAIRTAGLVPVYADIEAHGFNLDPAAARRVTGRRTAAVLPVHCFGVPCDLDGFAALAGATGVRVVYDAAHAVGARWRGRSLLDAGDASVTSFHATKVYSTVEGGAAVCRDPALKRALDRLRNHGIGLEDLPPPRRPWPPGFNGKLGEVHSAIGVLQLARLDAVVAARARVAAIYRERLSGVPTLRLAERPAGAEDNHGYFPVRVSDDHPLGRDGLIQALGARGIAARAYFAPLLSTLATAGEPRPMPAAAEAFPRAAAAACATLCLPIHSELTAAQAGAVADHVATLSTGATVGPSRRSGCPAP